MEEFKTVAITNTTFRPIAEAPGNRLRQYESLNPDFIRENLSPNKVAETKVIGPNGDTSIIWTENVISPYTKGGVHVMLFDSTSNLFRPTPTQMPDSEFEGMRILSADIVSYMQGMKDLDNISLGYNNSPLNYGHAEMGGMQSITTKHHIHIWNRKTQSDAGRISIDEIPRNTKDFILGDALTKLGSYVVMQAVSSEGREFIKEGSATIDERGFHAKLKTDLLHALQAPGFFGRFIKPLHMKIEQANADVWEAITTGNYNQKIEEARQAFEGLADRDKVYGDLQIIPELREPKERIQRIKDLKKKGYPELFLDKLASFSRFIKNRKDVKNEQNWIRNGLGYVLVINQQANEKNAEITIRPAVLIKSSKGGVVEALGIALRRVEVGATESVEEIENNKQNLAELKKTLPEQIVIKNSSNKIL